MLLRARRSFRDAQTPCEPQSPLDPGLKALLDRHMDRNGHSDETRFVLHALFAQLGAWASEEFGARVSVRRRAAAVRVSDLDGFQLGLVTCLHHRLRARGVTGLDDPRGEPQGLS